MAYTHIELTNPTRASVQLRQLVDSATQTRDLVLRISDILDTLKDGTDYSQIEAVYGLPVGQGQVVFLMVQAMRDQIIVPAAGLTIPAGNPGGYMRYITRLG